MLLVREYLILPWQEGTSGINQVNAGQVIFERYFLCAQMFFNGHGIISTAFDSCVICYNHYFYSGNTADTGNYSGSRNIVII